MRLLRAFILPAICFILLSSAAASAWFWPILGDVGPCPGSPCVGGPSPILPGTLEWLSQPTCGAQLFPFGYPYGVIQGCLNFGITPPFGFSSTGFPGAMGGTGAIGK